MTIADMPGKLPEPDFVLTCKVEVKDISYLDVQSKWSENRTEEMVFLVPQEGTQRDIFFAKWLPDTESDHVELACVLTAPATGFMRGAVMRRNKRCSEHHIFCMTKACEEELKPLKDHFIKVLVLPEDADKVLDFQKDYDLPGKKDIEVNLPGISDCIA